MQFISPPEWTASPQLCKYRTPDSACCDGLNFLRPHSCGERCVRMLALWLREERPDLEDVQIQASIASIARQKQQKNK